MARSETEARVVVLGGGAAGVAAALAAAQAGGRVNLVRRAPGATALSSGAVDLAGDALEMPGEPWAGRASTHELLRLQRRTRPDHPLSLAGVDGERAQELLEELCGELELLDHRPLSEPALVLPTDLGTFKSTTLCQRWSAGGDLPALAGARLGVVGFEDYPIYDASLLCESYAHFAARGGIELEARPVLVQGLRLRGDQHLDPAGMAAQLEQPAAIQRLTAELQQRCQRQGLTHLLLPPVMGLERWPRLYEALNRRQPAFEMLSSPPSVPGLRLQRAMDLALQRRGVQLLNHRATGFTQARQRVLELQLEGRPALSAAAFVLASGKFAGGGLVHDSEGLREPLFDLPVLVDGADPGDSPWPGRHLAREVSGPHPLMKAGIQVDAELRPLSAAGTPALENLFAAGSVVGGYDYITDRCGLGTALICGYLAGRNAALHASTREVAS